MNILVTGSEGFIAKNLILNLKLNKKNKIFIFNKKKKLSELQKLSKNCDLVYHLAGENKSNFKKNFYRNNVTLTKVLCLYLRKYKNKSPVIFASSIKSNEKNNYGLSKKKAEQILIQHKKINNSNVKILRLANVIGKGCKPNYNSFFSTLCFNITRNIETKNIKQNKNLKLIHIDKVINILIKLSDNKNHKKTIYRPPFKLIKIKDIIKKINKLWDAHCNGVILNTSSGIDRIIYSILISYAPAKNYFTLKKPFIDNRGLYVELLKTKNSGQIGLVEINPGMTRGQHFHNTKNEKFYLIRGKILWRKKNLLSGKIVSKVIDDKKFVEFISIPGWWHEIKNLGREKAIILVWANEIFNINKSDTYKL